MKQIIITLFVLLFIFQNLHAGTIKIPSDQPTIQVGIVSSSNGDTILVSPGTYYENINFNGKNIVLGSLFLTTGDTSYISQTVIDGNQQGCVVVFESGEDSTATLTGFTITNGHSFWEPFGGGISCLNSSNPKLINLTVTNNQTYSQGGAGIFCSGKSSPVLQEIKIINNSAEEGGIGGGIFCMDSSSIKIIDSEIKDNYANYGGGLASHNSTSNIENVNIVGNKSRLGGGLYFHSSNAIINNSIIKQNSSNGTSGGGGGIIATNTSSLIITNSQITNNSTLTTSAAVLHQSDGCGIYIRQSSSATIEDCKINYNYSTAYIANGGGIYVKESSINISRSEIIGNSCGGKGGGLCYYPEQKIKALKNVIIKNNYSYNDGGGLATNQNLLIPESSGCSIFLNKTRGNGTDIYMEVEDINSVQTIFLDTVTVSNPDDYQIYPIKNIDFYYNFAIFQSVNSDLYVSPSGSDSNNGASKDEALKTISFALLVASADSINHRTIYLAPGTYSFSATGEEFPIQGRSYISIKGEHADTTILDGENGSNLIELFNCNSVMLEDFTVQNGKGESVGGMGIYGSDLFLKNLIIKNNYSEIGSGGIRLSGEGISLKNLIITDNYSEGGVGGLYLGSSDHINLVNLTIANNISNRFDSSRSGGISSYGVYNLSILNSIIVSNDPTNLEFKSLRLPSLFSGANTVLISHSNIEGGEEEIIKNDSVFVLWLEDNIDKDPLFVGGNPFDYNLSDSSPCINAGTPFFVWEGDTLIDLSPEEYIGEAPDMGALESDVLISVEGEETVPTQFKLEQNYPNPFNPSTTIKYSISSVGTRHASSVRLVIYDILGRQVTTLVNKQQKSGNYEVKFDASNLTSGLYFYRISTNGFIKTMKMILLK